MSEVGALIVKLQAETAQFREDLGKVKSDLDNLQGGAEKTGESFDKMGEARGGLMLVEDAIGVRLPRHLNSLLAEIPAVSTAFSLMLPIAGVAVAIKIIGELIDKHEEMKEKQREMANSVSVLALSLDAETHSLENANLKLDDQIRGLEHKPKHNYLAEAINENIEAMDKWAAKSSDDFSKEEKDLAHYIGTWNILKNDGILGLDDFSGKLGRAVSDAALDVEKIGVHIAAVKTSMIGLVPGTQIYSDKVHDLVMWYGLLQAAQEKGVQAAKAYGDTGIGAMEAFQRGALESAQAVNSLNLEIEASHKRVKAASLEQGKENLKPLEDEAALQKIVTAGVEQHAQALIKLARTQQESASAAMAGGEDGTDDRLAKQKATIEAEKNDQIAAAVEALKSKQAAYEADLRAAADNEQEKKQLTAQWVNEVNAASDEVVQITADADKKSVAADRQAANERLAVSRSFHSAVDKAVQDSAQQQAQLTLKAQEQAAKNELALHRGTDAQIAAVEVAANKAETQLELDALNTRQKNLDKFGKDYLKSWVEIESEKTKVTQKSEAEQTAIMVAAAQKEAMEIKQSEDKMKEAIASDIANSIVMNKSLAASFRQTGEQMAEQMLKNLLMMELTGEKEKLIHAKNAFHKAFDAMSGIPPAPMWGYAAGAAAFAAVMSFEVGGKIPGEGPVPIVGHGGETVVTKALTDRVEAAERGGNMGASGQHTWNFAPQIHAVDAEGVDRVLAKHSSVFQRHVAATVRRMNK